MTNQTFKLPPRKWYTLEQAIKRIKQLTGEELEIEDLIHYWKIKKLELCTYCLMTPEKIKIGGTTLRNTGFSLYVYSDYIMKHDFKYKIEDILEVIKLHKSNTDGSYYYETEEFNQMTNTIEISLLVECSPERPILDENEGDAFYINGFLSIMPQRKIDIIDNIYWERNDILIILATPKNNEYDYRIVLEITNFDDEIHLNKNQLYILNDDLEDFINNKANPPEPEQYKHPKISTKTLNAQAEFLRNLIITQYGENYANNIRRELDNPSSEIRQDFEKKGLPTPSGKAVDRWINQP